MLPKKEVVKLIDLWAPRIINNLNLKHCTIDWYIVKCPPKETAAAKTFYENDSSRIYHIAVYYNKQKNEKDAIGSIVHELIHVRLRSYSRLVPKSKEKRADIVEENIVRALEALYVDLL